MHTSMAFTVLYLTVSKPSFTYKRFAICNFSQSQYFNVSHVYDLPMLDRKASSVPKHKLEWNNVKLQNIKCCKTYSIAKC